MKTIDALLRVFGARDRNCPSEASVLAYSENTLSRTNRLRVERHFAGCDDCRELLACLARETGETTVTLSQENVIEQTNRVLGYIRNDDLTRTRHAEKPRPVRGFYVSYPHLATVGLAICALLIAVPFIVPRVQSPADASTEAMTIGLKDQRRTEARISGGFAQSRYNGTRGEGDNASTDDLHFERALSKLRSVDEANAPYKDTVALARVYVARGTSPEVKHGLRILTGLAERGFDTAEVLNDSGVAYMQLDEYDKAIECFTTALTRTPGYEEALFNKALAEQRLRRDDDAKRDWQQFLSQSSDDQWKHEADVLMSELSTGNR